MAQKGPKTNIKPSSKQASAISKSHKGTTGQTKNSSANNNIVHSKTSSPGQSEFRPTENFIVIWLDSNIDESKEDTRNSITHLRDIVNSVKTFTNSDQCVHYLNEVKNEKVFVIVSGTLGQRIVPQISEMTQLASIYVFCDDKSKHEQWTQKCKKIKGIFTRINLLCDALKVDVRQSESDLTPISIVSSSSTTDLNELDQSFMYSQLLKEILLENESNEKEKQKLVDFCRLHYANNDKELDIIEEFERKYPQPSTIWWYTRECFIYPMLNKALRTQDVEIIIKMGFFVRDLHRQIEQMHAEMKHHQLLTVYRGQGMIQSEFEKMKKSKGGLLSFNNFLSTSTDRSVSLIFARRARDNPDLTAIIFRMEIDPSISMTGFASLDKMSYFGNTEKEILFSMHTVFRIGDMKQIEDRLFEVNLTLTSDNDQQLTLLTQHMQKATAGPTGLHRMAKLMIKMGEFDKAEEIYTTLLKTTSNDDREQLAFLHHQLGYMLKQKDDLVSALSQYQQSLDFYLTYLSSDDPCLSPIYSNIGSILQDRGDLAGALEHYKRALSIDLHAPKPDQLNIATHHNNIGAVFKEQGKFDEALKSYGCALEIKLACLPSRHPSLATTYSNIASVHFKKGDNPNALSYFEKTLEIQQKSLPPNHPSLAIIHNNMACVLGNLHRTQEAIEHVEQAVDIGRRSLGPNHPSVQEDQRHLDELRRKL